MTRARELEALSRGAAACWIEWDKAALRGDQSVADKWKSAANDLQELLRKATWKSIYEEEE